MAEENEYSELSDLETVHTDDNVGSIQINNNVVANIVDMAAREVTGVYGIASGGLRDDLKGLLGKRDTSITVDVNAADNYVIGVKLILIFGVNLAKVATNVQNAIREQVENMTDKEVARVNVIVDEVRHPKAPEIEYED